MYSSLVPGEMRATGHQKRLAAEGESSFYDFVMADSKQKRSAISWAEQCHVAFVWWPPGLFTDSRLHLLISMHRILLILHKAHMMLQVLEVVEAVGKLDGERLKRAQECFEGQKGQRKKFLMLRLPNPGHRAGQPEQLNQASLLQQPLVLECGFPCNRSILACPQQSAHVNLSSGRQLRCGF